MPFGEPVELEWKLYSANHLCALVSLVNGKRIMALHDITRDTFAVGVVNVPWVNIWWLETEDRVNNLGPLECLCMVEHYVEKYGP